MNNYKNKSNYLSNPSYLKRGKNSKSFRGKYYYTLEKCQEILSEKNSTYKAVEIIRGNHRYDDICIVECKHGNRKIKCKYFYRYDFVYLQCRHERRDEEKIKKIKNILKNSNYSFYKFEVDRSNVKDHKYYVHLFDTDGYYYVSKYRHLEKNIKIGFEIVHRVNKYNLHNINVWLEKNNSIIRIISDDYNGNTSPLKAKCLLCGNEFDTYWANVQHGNECPLCSTSRGEKRIREYLETNKIAYEYEKKYDNNYWVEKKHLLYNRNMIDVKEIMRL